MVRSDEVRWGAGAHHSRHGGPADDSLPRGAARLRVVLEAKAVGAAALLDKGLSRREICRRLVELSGA